MLIASATAMNYQSSMDYQTNQTNQNLEEANPEHHCRYHPYQWQLASSSLRRALGHSPILGGPSSITAVPVSSPVDSLPLLSERATTPPATYAFCNTIIRLNAFQVPLCPGGRPRIHRSEYASTMSAGDTRRWCRIYAEAIVVGNLLSRAMQSQARKDKEVFFPIILYLLTNN